MTAYIVLGKAFKDGIVVSEIDSVWFMEIDAEDRCDQIMNDGTLDYEFCTIESVEVHGKEHLKITSRKVSNEEVE